MSLKYFRTEMLHNRLYFKLQFNVTWDCPRYTILFPHIIYNIYICILSVWNKNNLSVVYNATKSVYYKNSSKAHRITRTERMIGSPDLWNRQFYAHSSPAHTSRPTAVVPGNMMNRYEVTSYIHFEWEDTRMLKQRTVLVATKRLYTRGLAITQHTCYYTSLSSTLWSRVPPALTVSKAVFYEWVSCDLSENSD
jgi:hypothetical protein